MDVLGATIFWGSTTFAIPSVYPIPGLNNLTVDAFVGEETHWGVVSRG